MPTNRDHKNFLTERFAIPPYPTYSYALLAKIDASEADRPAAGVGMVGSPLRRGKLEVALDAADGVFRRPFSHLPCLKTQWPFCFSFCRTFFPVGGRRKRFFSRPVFFLASVPLLAELVSLGLL